MVHGRICPPLAHRGGLTVTRTPDKPTAPAAVPCDETEPLTVGQGAAGEGYDPVVSLVGVHKAFDSLKVLDGIDLDMHRGQITVVLGPSGTGKSVLLKHIVGLIKPDKGHVYFEGRCVDAMTDRELVEMRTRIGYLFQMGALFDSMTVEENVCFPLLEHTRYSKKQRCDQARRVLAMVGLQGSEHKYPSNLSGGQRKRVALARAIVLEPTVVLYDEPTTGLDPIRAGVINELIVALSRNLGISSVVVTHDMSSAGKIADRMVLLYDGRIICDGDPQAFRQTDNDLVQRFVTGQAEEADLQRIREGFAPGPGQFSNG
jgi:phospholipid/cholesterol/gamma-HCH transport system ATP-binding protein